MGSEIEFSTHQNAKLTPTIPVKSQRAQKLNSLTGSNLQTSRVQTRQTTRKEANYFSDSINNIKS